MPESNHICVSSTTIPNVVSEQEWEKKRIELLDKEKELTKRQDEITKLRRELPWVKVEKEYSFIDIDTNLRVPFEKLFKKHQDLIVYHFMFGPDWTTGCKSCSLWADSFSGVVPHLERKTAFAVVCRGPIDRVRIFKNSKVTWNFKMYSSLLSDFNFDYKVSFRKEDVGKNQYNYGKRADIEELPGVSVFHRDVDDLGQATIYHTYSAYARGLEPINNIWGFLDMLPKGRDEQQAMDWVKHKEEYLDIDN